MDFHFNRNSIFVFSLAVIYCLFSWWWLNLDEEVCLGSDMSLFMSCFTPYDHFIFSGIMVYLFGIVGIIGYGVLKNTVLKNMFSQEEGEVVPPFLHWMILFPLFILIGIILYKAQVLSDRADWIYLIVASMVSVLMVEWENKRLKNKYILWGVVVTLYVLSFIFVFLPTAQFRP